MKSEERGGATTAATIELVFSEDGTVRASDREGNFQREAGFQVEGRVVEHTFSAHFPPQIADLVDVAMAVYTADRLCPRRPKNPDRYNHYWHRRICVQVPLREPERWHDPEVERRLSDALAFLTEDEWSFRFVARSHSPRVAQGYLFDTQPQSPMRVALFSGGLDSFAGLTAELQHKPDHTFVLLCGYTNSRLYAVQCELLETFSARVNSKIIPVMVPFGIRRQGGSYNDDERTQRTRGFIYSALGAAVALSAGADSLACYENGIGALNLPLTPAQLGAQNARSAHPRAICEIADLIGLVADREFEIELPFLFRTKGEISASIVESGFANLVQQTVSCDGFPRRVGGSPQCGECTSCLLRRQALHAVGLEDWDAADGYGRDLNDPWVDDSSGLPFELRAMLDQARRFRQALSAADPWLALAREFPGLEETVLRLEIRGMDATETRRKLLRLVGRYCEEWDFFAQRRLPLGPPAA